MDILLIEDEQLAGEKLKGYIKEFVDPLAQITWLRSISELKEFISSQKHFDLIFSDIELLDGNVFSVYDTTKIAYPIIFCTAYDQFVLKAFKANGIAYLLKPYDEEQFKDAWQKYKLLFDKGEQEISNTIIDELKLIVQNKDSNFKTRFTIKKPNGIFLLSVEDIIYFQSQGDFILAYDQKGNRHIINQSLGKILAQLNPNYFFQINRSEIINVDFIEKFESHFKNKLAIKMKGEEEILFTSGSRTPEFREWVE